MLGAEKKSSLIHKRIRFLIATPSPREFVEVGLVIAGAEKKRQ
jgi:hypothetical protein